MSDFKLLGHSCPADTYPSVVLPVGIDADGSLVVLYQGSEAESEGDPIEEAQQYVHHSPAQNERLKFFDPRNHRLFAYSVNNVEFYTKGHEVEFFSDFLSSPKSSATDPFVRLSLATLTGREELIFREAGRCHLALKDETPAYWREWCENVLRRALDSIREPTPTNQRRRILLIEDHDSTSDSIRAHFEVKGYNVTCASNGVTGLSLAIETNPDVIILDLHVPFMNGYEVLERLRSNARIPRIPVIVWSQFYEEWGKREVFKEIPTAQAEGEIPAPGIREIFWFKNHHKSMTVLDRLVSAFSQMPPLVLAES